MANLVEFILNLHFLDTNTIKVSVDLDRLMVFTDYILFIFSKETQLIELVSELECNNRFIIQESKLPLFTYEFIPNVKFKIIDVTVCNKHMRLLNIGSNNFSYNISSLNINKVNELKLQSYSLIGYKIEDVKIIQAPLKIKLTI